MRRITFILLTSIVATAFAQDKPEQAAQKPTEAWLGLVDAGKYAESWDQAAAMLKSQVTKDQWQQTIKTVRDETGKLKSRELKSAQYTETLPNAPPGKYVVFQYHATFDSGSFIETVAATQEKDGVWRVAGYFVKAE